MLLKQLYFFSEIEIYHMETIKLEYVLRAFFPKLDP